MKVHITVVNTTIATTALALRIFPATGRGEAGKRETTIDL